MKTIAILVLLTLCCMQMLAQETLSGEMLQQAADAAEAGRDQDILAEELVETTQHPVDLNSAGEEQIRTIPFLSIDQQQNLLLYLLTYGEVFSLYELQSIKGFDSTLIHRIHPFVTIKPKSNLPPLTPGNLFRYGRHDLLFRAEQSFPQAAGYKVGDSVKLDETESFYPGSPQKYYFRYTYNWFEKVRIGFAGEKDPGEQFFRGAQSKGMDYYAGYLSLNNMGVIENLTLGNFRAGFGQGLTFCSGTSMNSTPGMSSNPVLSSGIRPSIGMSEGSYLRGLGTTIKLSRFRLSAFISYHSRDATLTIPDTTSHNEAEISSLIESGYHRTNAELAKRNAMTELITGGNVNFTLSLNQKFGIRTGITAVYVKYSAKVSADQDLYKYFSLTGDNNMITGFDYQLRYGKLFLFGELSRSRNGGFAWLCAASIAPDPRLSINAILRSYQPGYQNLWANAFGQQSMNANEQGVFVSVQAALHQKLNLTGFIDCFRMPWLKYRVDAPSSGLEFGIQSQWLVSGNAMLIAKYLQANSMVNMQTETGERLHKLSNAITRNYRCIIELTSATRFVFTTRLDIKESDLEEQAPVYGFMVCQDFHYTGTRWLAAFTLRFALFDVPNYETRIYTCEPEVLFGYSVPAYQGKGLRTCAVLKLKLMRKVALWVRGGVTWYKDRLEVGTGLDLTLGNLRGEITGQIQVKL